MYWERSHLLFIASCEFSYKHKPRRTEGEYMRSFGKKGRVLTVCKPDLPSMQLDTQLPVPATPGVDVDENASKNIRGGEVLVFKDHGIACFPNVLENQKHYICTDHFGE